MRTQKGNIAFGCLCILIIVGYFLYNANQFFQADAVAEKIMANNLEEAVTHQLDLGPYTDRKDGVLFFGEDEVVLKTRNHTLLGTSELTMKYFDLADYDLKRDYSSMHLCDEQTCFRVGNASEPLVERLNNSPKAKRIVP